METLDSLKSGLASGRLAGCTSLKLADGLTEFPMEILSLAESLTFLNLSNNQLSALPSSFAQLTKLEIVFFNNNAFETYPDVLANCPALSMVSFKANRIRAIAPEALSTNLRWLILTNNKLTILPSTIGKLHRLQKLMLAGNQLTALPKALANCANLELVRLAANQLKHLPDWLYTLPRLSWIAYAGNPFCQDASATQSAPLSSIWPQKLHRNDVLGEGASGVIYKGVWTPEESTQNSTDTSNKSQESTSQTVAIKIFKGEITSDGSPLDEMRACIAAGQHPNLVNVLGKIDSPTETGLVFDFIPPDYTNLGGPPSLESCTRDIYQPHQSFTLQEILSIISGMASVLAHLHSRGIMHGDFYAHNILVNAEGHSILGDFGAASFYRPESATHPLEKIEVRAFGCLLEELLLRCTEKHTDKKHKSNRNITALQQLNELQKRCLSHSLADRPALSQVVALLSQAAQMTQQV